MRSVIISAWRHCDLAGRLDIIVIGLLSLAAWYIIIEKLLVFRDIRLKHLLFDETMARGEQPARLNSPLHNVFAYGRRLVASGHISGERLLLMLERYAAQELEGAARNLGFLVTVTAVCPFLGLLGTIWGLLIAFNSIAISGSSSIGVVASGVAEALITTVAGLLVAIPAAAAHSYFAERLRTLAVGIDLRLPDIAAHLESVTRDHGTP